MTSPRLQDINPFYVMELMNLAHAAEAAGRDVVHMEVGEPDFGCPAPIMRAARAAVDEGRTQYTAALGMPPLRAAIAREYSEFYGVEIDPQRVIVTPGASGALQLVMALLLDQGDDILMADPGYPCNRHMARLFGGRAVPVKVDASTAYQPTVAQLEAARTAQTRAVLLATPSNPAGSTLTPQELAAIAAWASGHGIELVVDEIYQGLVYGRSHSTALAVAPQAFVVNSFSKYYGMTGWRVGWLIAPQDRVGPLERLAQNFFIAPSTPGQHAALAAFLPETRPLLEDRRLRFEERRDHMLPALRALGLEIPVDPTGAFYVYADAGRFTDDSLAFCKDILERTGVVITPGVDFGTHRAGQHLRFAYTSSLDRLNEGLTRLGEYLQALNRC